MQDDEIIRDSQPTEFLGKELMMAVPQALSHLSSQSHCLLQQQQQQSSNQWADHFQLITDTQQTQNHDQHHQLMQPQQELLAMRDQEPPQKQLNFEFDILRHFQNIQSESETHQPPLQEESAVQSVQLNEVQQFSVTDLLQTPLDEAFIAKQKRSELCSKHQLRKTLLCQTCKKFICDRCLIDEGHGAHKMQNLSKIANDILSIFKNSLGNLSTNLQQIEQTRPQDWRGRLRRQLLDFFDGIQQKVDLLRQFQLKHLRTILGSMSLENLSHELLQLRKSAEMLHNHKASLDAQFDQSNFGAVASRFPQYKVLLKSLEVLQVQSQNISQIVKDKSEHIMNLESQLKLFKKKLNGTLRQQIQEYRELKETDLETIQWEKTLGAKVLTPFYVYIKEKLGSSLERQPGQSYLEVIAQLQTQWVAESMETRERYQRTAIQQNKTSLGRLPSFTELDDPVVVQPKETYQDIQLLKSCAGVERVFKITHVPQGVKKRDHKVQDKSNMQRLESDEPAPAQVRMKTQFQLKKNAQADQEHPKLVKRETKTAEQIMLKRRRKISDKQRMRLGPIRLFQAAM